LLLSEHIKETVKLTLPISIGQLGHIMMGVVDSLMVGRLGAAPLAAAVLVNAIFFMIIVLGFGMTMAITPLVAIASGEKKLSTVKDIFNNGFWINLLFSAILIVLTYLVSCMLPYLNQPPDVTVMAVSYLRIQIISIAPFILFQVGRQYLDGLSIVKPAMYVAIIANFFNAFFNWVFIYGKFGFPAMGLDGAGIATTGSRIFMGGAIFMYLYKSSINKELVPIISFKKLDKHLIHEIIRLGLPSGFQYFIEVAAFTFSAIIIGWFGKTSLAAHQIAMNLSSLTYMVIMGISSAGTIRVGNYFGARDNRNLRIAGFTAIGLAGSIMLLSAVTLLLLNRILPALYINDSEVIGLASKLIIIAAFFQLFDGLQATSVGTLRGLTDVKVPLIITFASYWIVALPAGYLLAVHFNLGAVGVWIGLSIALFLVAVSCVIRFAVKSRVTFSE
jgi:MATE family multidrug resistance protein